MSERLLQLNAPCLAARVALAFDEIPQGGYLQIMLEMEMAETVKVSIRTPIYDTIVPSVKPVTEPNTKDIALFPLVHGLNRIELKLGPIYLRAGRYDLGILVNDWTGISVLLWSLRQHQIAILGDASGECAYQLPGEILVNS